jgi:hypothetical protein
MMVWEIHHHTTGKAQRPKPRRRLCLRSPVGHGKQMILCCISAMFPSTIGYPSTPPMHLAVCPRQQQPVKNVVSRLHRGMAPPPLTQWRYFGRTLSGCGLGCEERCMISLAVCRLPRSRHRRSTFSPTLRSSLDWVSTGSDAGTLQLVNRCREGEPSKASGTSRRTACRLVGLAGGTMLDPDSGLGFCGLQTQRSAGLTVSQARGWLGFLRIAPFGHRCKLRSGPQASELHRP